MGFPSLLKVHILYFSRATEPLSNARYTAFLRDFVGNEKEHYMYGMYVFTIYIFRALYCVTELPTSVSK